MPTKILYVTRLTARPTTKGNMGDWQGRHMQAVHSPRGPEEPIVAMLRGWLEYADVHADRYECGIGQDGVLGDEWANIGAALLALLNGELGRLDGGTLDGLIRGAMKDEGFDPNLM